LVDGIFGVIYGFAVAAGCYAVFRGNPPAWWQTALTTAFAVLIQVGWVAIWVNLAKGAMDHRGFPHWLTWIVAFLFAVGPAEIVKRSAFNDFDKNGEESKAIYTIPTLVMAEVGGTLLFVLFAMSAKSFDVAISTVPSVFRVTP